jgi:hypothetical protein
VAAPLRRAIRLVVKGKNDSRGENKPCRRLNMTIFQQKNKFRQRCHTLRRNIKLNLTRRENKGFVAREKRYSRSAWQSAEEASRIVF